MSSRLTAKQEKREDRGKALRDYLTLLFVVLTTVGIGIQACVLHNSDVTFKETLVSQKESSERQLRAYVTAGEAKIQNFGSVGIIKGSIIIKNLGQTPAYKVKIRVAFGFDEYPLRTRPPAPDDLVEETDLGPGDFTQNFSPMVRLLTADEIVRIRNGSAAIYFIGAVQYLDAFGHDRTTKFRRLFGGYASVNDQGAMATDKEGNEAD